MTRTIAGCALYDSINLSLSWPATHFFCLFSMLKAPKKAHFRKHFEVFFFIADSYKLRKKLYSSFCSNASILSLIRKFCSSSIHSLFY